MARQRRSKMSDISFSSACAFSSAAVHAICANWHAQEFTFSSSRAAFSAISFGAHRNPTRKPVIEKRLEKLSISTVRSFMPGISSMLRKLPSNTMVRYTSSVITVRSASSAICAISSSVFIGSTRPVGLDGELMMTARVRPFTRARMFSARLRRFSSPRKLTKRGTAPHMRTMAE